jgi:hypothetical protein
MSFSHIYARSTGGDLAKIDNDTGQTATIKDLGYSVYAVERDTDGNVYVMDGSKLHKYTPDLSTELWVSSEDVFGAVTLRMGPDETDIYGGGGYWVYRVNSDDGSVVWKNGLAEEETYDLSFDSQWLYIKYLDTSVQQRIDPSTGTVESTAEMAGYSTNASGIAVYNGQYMASMKDGPVLYSSDSFAEGNAFNDDSFSTSNFSNLEVDTNALYTAGTSQVARVAFDGTTEWQVDPPGGYYRSIDVSPDSLWVIDDDDTMHKLDKSDGSTLWSNSDVNLDYTRYTIGGFPSLDMIGEANYFVPTEISGTVVNGGSAVSGAKVTVIDDTSDEVFTTTTTDANGNWSATVPDTRLHVVAQYEDGSGTVYNTTSYPFVNSQ